MLADVRELDGHYVARPDPGVVEASGERFDARFEGGMRERPPLVDEGRPARVRPGVPAEPAGKGVRTPPPLLDVRTDPLRVEGEGRPQGERLLAESEVVLERDEPFLAIAPAAAERIQHGVVAGAEPPPLLEVADEGHLGGGETDPLRDLGVPHAELVAVRLDRREVLLADRVAPPGLEVVAEGEDGLAVGGDHLVGHPELRPGEALGHRPVPAPSPSPSRGGAPAARARRIGSASSAPVAMGQTRMHSKHWARRPPDPTDILYQSILWSGSKRASRRPGPRPRPPSRRRGSRGPPRTAATSPRRRPCRSASPPGGPRRQSSPSGTAPGRTSCRGSARACGTCRRTTVPGTGSRRAARPGGARARSAPRRSTCSRTRDGGGCLRRATALRARRAPRGA